MERSREDGESAVAAGLGEGNSSRQAMVVNGERQELRGNSSRETSSDDELYFRYHPFTKHFTAALHSLLISCSRQDVLSYYEQFHERHQDFLYEVFTLAVTQIHENVATEFRLMCKEGQVLEALDYVKSVEFLSATDIRPSVPPKEVVRDVAVKRKQDEVAVMKQQLLQTRAGIDSLASQRDRLRENLSAARDVRSVDAVLEKISAMNLNLEKVTRKNWVCG